MYSTIRTDGVVIVYHVIDTIPEHVRHELMGRFGCGTDALQHARAYLPALRA